LATYTKCHIIVVTVIQYVITCSEYNY